jgi:integrase
MLTWAQRRRMAPRDWNNPCRHVQLRKEDNEIVRFLSDSERALLLEACRHAKWPKLYLVVLMGLTTGARRGELTGLRWGDIDFEASVASVQGTKNGDRKVLPLTPAVVDELTRFRAAQASLVFASKD